jgi:uncharacterized protein YndB with AHSA1/START domain
VTATASPAIPGPDQELVVTRVFDAPRPLVFRAWTDPGLAVHWWGPKGFTLVSCEMEVRTGGKWRRSMRAPDGSFRCARGVYREIVAPERLVFTYSWEDDDGRPGHETLVSVTFVELGGRTELTLRQAIFATVTARDAHRQGWASCLDRFADYLATLSLQAFQDGDRRCSAGS